MKDFGASKRIARISHLFFSTIKGAFVTHMSFQKLKSENKEEVFSFHRNCCTENILVQISFEYSGQKSKQTNKNNLKTR